MRNRVHGEGRAVRPEALLRTEDNQQTGKAPERGLFLCPETAARPVIGHPKKTECSAGRMIRGAGNEREDRWARSRRRRRGRGMAADSGDTDHGRRRTSIIAALTVESPLFDYQSVRHCSKTWNPTCTCRSLFDYQSVRHCSKTAARESRTATPFDYQSVRHCSKTVSEFDIVASGFDYQSVRHCSKTQTSTWRGS